MKNFNRKFISELNIFIFNVIRFIYWLNLCRAFRGFISEFGVERSKSFDAIYERLLEASGTKTDSELARVLGISPQSVNGARERGSVPPAWVQSYAEISGVSSDWLFFGRGPMRPSDPAQTTYTTAKPDHKGQMCPDSALTAPISSAAKRLEELNAPPIPEHYSIGLQILFEVDEAFEEVLQERNATLSPTARAEVLCQLCRLVIDEGVENRRPAKIFRLIKGVLAANG